MNPQDMKEFVDGMESRVSELEKFFARTKIDHQLYLKANKDIKPGIAVKVAYDEKGLIVGSQELTISDIPTLPMTKIDGLTDRVDEVSSKVAELAREMKNYNMSTQIGKIVNSGTKVNVDENGRVVSVSDLLVEDIPVLPMSKIDGLTDLLEMLKNSIQSPVSVVTESTPVKQVIASITMENLPNELLTRLNEIESRFTEYASSRVVDALNKTLGRKADANPEIKPGQYTKVRVDANGFVTNGDHLTVEDLPTITPEDISGLTKILSSKVDHSDLSDIHMSIATLVDKSKNVGDIMKLQSAMDRKADDLELKNLSREVSRIQDIVNGLADQASGEMVMEQFQKLEGEISSLAARVTALERGN